MSLDSEKLVYDMVVRIHSKMDTMDIQFCSLQTEILGLKRQASFWGALSGGIASLPPLLFNVLKVF